MGDTLRETRCVKPPEGGARLFFRPAPTGPRGPRDPRPPAPQHMSTTTRTTIDEPAAPDIDVDGVASHERIGQRQRGASEISAHGWR